MTHALWLMNTEWPTLFRPRNEQTTFFQIVNEVSRLETQPLGGNTHPNPFLPSIQDDIFHGKPVLEPPSYDLPPPSYDEIMKSNKIWIIFISKGKLSFEIIVLTFAEIRFRNDSEHHLAASFWNHAWAYFAFRLNIQQLLVVLANLLVEQVILMVEYSWIFVVLWRILLFTNVFW